MSVFSDTSGFLAAISEDDAFHEPASRIWAGLIRNETPVRTTNYVVIETIALLHSRCGVGAVRRFVEGVLAVITVDFIHEQVHAAAIGAVIAGGRRGPGVVDCTSFEMMRGHGITEALAFDQHFWERGYVLPNVE